MQWATAACLGPQCPRRMYSFRPSWRQAKPEQRDFFHSHRIGARRSRRWKRIRAIVVKGRAVGRAARGLDGKTWFDATTARHRFCSRRSKIASAADLTALTAAVYAQANQALYLLAAVVAAGIILSLGRRGDHGAQHNPAASRTS